MKTYFALLACTVAALTAPAVDLSVKEQGDYLVCKATKPFVLGDSQTYDAIHWLADTPGGTPKRVTVQAVSALPWVMITVRYGENEIAESTLVKIEPYKPLRVLSGSGEVRLLPGWALEVKYKIR